MSPRMPYHDGSMENGAGEMIRRPCGPRKTTANQTNARNPANLSARLKILQVLARDSPAETSGEMEQKAAMAERYIKTHHQSPDQPSAAVSGVSCTIRMPMAVSDSVRITTWMRISQGDCPLLNLPPSARGMDIPTMKRKAGKTRSTKVIPLPPW